jgi:hypothetical protein
MDGNMALRRIDPSKPENTFQTQRVILHTIGPIDFKNSVKIWENHPLS